MTNPDLCGVLADLAAEFDQQSQRCQDAVGMAECALEAAVVWENAAKRVRKKLTEVQGA